jgi:hypothetical protein
VVSTLCSLHRLANDPTVYSIACANKFSCLLQTDEAEAAFVVQVCRTATRHHGRHLEVERSYDRLDQTSPDFSLRPFVGCPSVHGMGPRLGGPDFGAEWNVGDWNRQHAIASHRRPARRTIAPRRIHEMPRILTEETQMHLARSHSAPARCCCCRSPCRRAKRTPRQPKP